MQRLFGDEGGDVHFATSQAHMFATAERMSMGFGASQSALILV